MANTSAVTFDLLSGPTISKADPNVRKWDLRFLKLALSVAEWSKDPSRKVGAVIVKPNRRIVSLGYNGFATGVDDSEERYTEKAVKYELVVHAEINAILTAERDLTGMTIYSTLMPCSRCAAVIINSGIKKAVILSDDMTDKSWDNSRHLFELSETQFMEADVKVVKYNMSELINA